MKPDLRPMLATLTDKPFDNPDWIFETKWDGFRLIAEIKDGSVALYSRNLIDVSSKYPSICRALSKIKGFAVIDGELVALDAQGRSRFQLLQNAEREKVRLMYCAFDLLYRGEEDLRGRPLIERKEMLEKLLPKNSLLHYSAHVWGDGIAAFRRAARAGEEGVMAKLASSLYYSGQRTRDWLKVKASLGQEVVIVGFTAPRRSREYFGSLLLAVRGASAILWLRDLAPRETLALSFFGGTQLPLVVAIVGIGMDRGEIASDVGASLVGAGMISVLVFPLVGLRLAGGPSGETRSEPALANPVREY